MKNSLEKENKFQKGDVERMAVPWACVDGWCFREPPKP